MLCLLAPATGSAAEPPASFDAASAYVYVPPGAGRCGRSRSRWSSRCTASATRARASARGCSRGRAQRLGGRRADLQVPQLEGPGDRGRGRRRADAPAGRHARPMADRLGQPVGRARWCSASRAAPSSPTASPGLPGAHPRRGRMSAGTYTVPSRPAPPATCRCLPVRHGRPGGAQRPPDRRPRCSGRSRSGSRSAAPTVNPGDVPRQWDPLDGKSRSSERPFVRWLTRPRSRRDASTVFADAGHKVTADDGAAARSSSCTRRSAPAHRRRAPDADAAGDPAPAETAVSLARRGELCRRQPQVLALVRSP